MARERNISMPLGAWPVVDRRALELALQEGDDDEGCAVHWGLATRALNVRFYGYWLQFLARRGELEADAAPSARVTKPRLSAYYTELGRRVSPVSRVMMIAALRNTVKVLDPAGDHRPLALLVRCLKRTAKPSRDQRHLLVAPSEMLYAGIRRMQRHQATANADPAAAIRYGDGLMMAMIVAKAVRRSNFAGMLKGRNITRNVMDIYEVRFDLTETKARRRIRAELPRKLTPFIDRWFTGIRDVLLRGRTSEAMWVTTLGTDMSPGNFYRRFCTATEQELGRRINPHLVRKIVHTGVAIAAPDQIHMVPSLLDQTSDQSAAYNLADQLSGSDAYLKLLEARRREAIRSVGKPTGGRRKA